MRRKAPDTRRQKMNNTVNVFFATDENYLPYLTVAIQSLKAYADREHDYRVRVLTTSESADMERALNSLSCGTVTVTVHNVRKKIEHIKDALALRLRDYYSESIYYRMFIPSMFPSLSRAIYLDSDIVLCRNVADLWHTELKGALIGAVTDESVISEPIFSRYVMRHIGLTNARYYFNSGVLLMDLDAMRRARIEEKFVHVLSTYNFCTVAPDQDYLNFLCRGRVHYLDRGWNKHAIDVNGIPQSELYLMHYNMFTKPWHYRGIMNEELFWHHAKDTEYYAQLCRELEAYTDAARQCDLTGAEKLLAAAAEITDSGECIADTIVRGYFDHIGLKERKQA